MRPDGSGLAGWLFSRLPQGFLRGRFHAPVAKPRMELVERIALGPQQNLALIEADGRRLLVATSGDTGPVFYALDGQKHSPAAIRPARVSW